MTHQHEPSDVTEQNIARINDLEYKLFPRLSALSEVLWTPTSDRNWSGFSSELPVMYKRYGLWGTNFHKQ